MNATNDTPETPDEVAAPVAAPKGRPRQPSLTATIDGVAHALKKYPFPTKPVSFNVFVNDVETIACNTSGRGASYSYLLVNNTGFYLPKDVVIGAGAELAVNFPADYVFDDEQAVRISTYKSKVKREASADEADESDESDEDCEAAAEAESAYLEAEVAEEAAAESVEAPAKAKRRGRK